MTLFWPQKCCKSANLTNGARFTHEGGGGTAFVSVEVPSVGMNPLTAIFVGARADFLRSGNILYIYIYVIN